MTAFRRFLFPLILIMIFALAASPVPAFQQVELVRELGGKTAGADQCRLSGPRAIAAAGDRYYIADSEAHRVLVVDCSGKLLRSWGEKGDKPGQFREPAGIALDERGRIYVSDTGNNRVQVFDADGKWLLSFGSKGEGPREFNAPLGLRASKGLVYVADSKNGRVLVLTTGGIAVQRIAVRSEKDAMKTPVDVAMDALNRIYVLDAGSGNVRVFDPAGAQIGVIGSKGKGVEGFSEPRGIAVDSRGNIYVSDTGNYKLKKLDQQGKLLGCLGNEGKGPGQFLSAAGLAIDQEQRVAVLDSEKNTMQLFAWEAGDARPLQAASPRPIVEFLKDFPGEVSALSAAGQRVWTVAGDSLTALGIAGGRRIGSRGSEPGSLKSARGIAVDARGAFWVADTGNDRIQKFDREGNAVLTIGRSGSDEGEFRAPSGIAIGPRGRIYVADGKNKRIQVFNPQGIFLNAFGKAGKLAGQFGEPVDAALDGSGNVYVADRGNDRIAKYDGNGNMIWEAGATGPLDGRFKGPENILVTPDGEVYVLDAGNARVQVFDDRGTYLRQFGSAGREAGEFSSPLGMALQDGYRLAVGDRGNRRVQVFAIRNTPAIPAELSAQVRMNEVQVRWKPNNETFLEQYHVYRADSDEGEYKLIGSTADPYYIDRNLPSNRTFHYRASSKAREGQESGFSPAIAAVTPKLVPAPPKELKIAASVKQMTLSWVPNTEPFFSSYHVYRSKKDGAGFEFLARVDKPFFVDSQLEDETQYFYRLTAVGKEGDESVAGAVVSETTLKAPQLTPPVEIAGVEMGEIYASSYKYYESHPLGKVVVGNNTDMPLSPVKLSFTIKNFMDFPTEQVIEMPAKQQTDVPILAVFNNKILDVTENTPLQTEIALTYYVNGETKTVTRSFPLMLYERHALVWDKKAKLGAFVTPKDPPVVEFTRAAILPYVDAYPSLPQPIVYARSVYAGLGAYGLAYIVDPSSPFAQFSKQTGAVDYLEYPRDTLARKSGDCDDLSTLFAACLESIGISTAFVDVPGHVFVMFNTGVSDKDRATLGFPGELLVAHEGTFWIPVEMTMVGASFTRAWQKGAEEYRDWSAKGSAEIVSVQQAWEQFKPVTLAPSNNGTAKVTKEEIEAKFKDELDSLAAQRLANLSSGYLDVLKKSPNDLAALGKLGILYGENGYYAEAMDQFQKMLSLDKNNATAWNNIGNLNFLQGKVDEARKAYESAFAAEPGEPGIMANLARALFKAGKKDEARSMLTNAASSDPRVLRRYFDLVAELGIVK